MASKARDRLHWIVLRGGLLLLAVLSALSIPLLLVGAFRTDDLTWDGDVGYSTDLPKGFIATNPGASLMFEGTVGVRIDDPSNRLALLSVAPDVLLAATISYVAWVLLLVVLNVNAGRPFDGAVPRLLATLAPVIAAAAVGITFLSAYANQEIMVAALHPDELSWGTEAVFEPDIFRMIAWLFVALFVGVIARAFAEGRRLADDTEGLV